MTGGNTKKADLAFFRNLVQRQIRQDYLENITGFAWLVLQPLILLAVYAFVFTTIFKSRIPDSEVGFVAYLAVAFWPWTAFSESILKATHSITGNAALIGKVAFATEQLPLAMVCATFLMNMIGYVAVLLVLQLIGTDIHWLYLPLAIPVLVLLCLLACSIALFTSAIQVFVKDTGQILPPLMTLWFFMTPILYSPAQLPAGLANVMAWNPMNWFVFQLRELLLFGRINAGLTEVLTLLGVVALAALFLAFFRRFSGHFEDFF
ncbi:MAG: ABC transporter permease [Xanthomonadales bacterium]|nr:ABC transporter permease [Xanthomonadales bacterium]NNL95277.1 ABC transporter permease [Xanthomonadales bacterium]